MKPSELLEGAKTHCRALPGATENVQWDNDLVFKVCGKMFCCTGLESTSKLSFKVEDERFLELTDQPGITPAPYLARAKWVQVNPAQCKLDLKMIKFLIKCSYELVVSKLPKKTQAKLS